MNGDYNGWMILLATVAGVGIGMVWYAPPVFGKAWQKMSGISEGAAPGLSAFALWAGGYLIIAITLAYLFKHLGANDAYQGARWGLTLGLAIVAPGAIGSVTFAKRPMKLFLIDMGYMVVALGVMGAIIGAGR